MSKCTASEAIEAMEYWIGYHEKEHEKYSKYRDKDIFNVDAGDKNYTYAGYFCGVNPGQWCAMMVTTAITEACGGNKEDARYIMGGVWPYTACGQIVDACPEIFERRVPAKPRVGDIIIFSDDGTSRTHTGIVYKLDDTTVYTIEGNSGNQCRRRSYFRNSDYIYGYIHPRYASALATGEDPATVQSSHYDSYCMPVAPELSKGLAGKAVAVMQMALFLHGFENITIDGEFGNQTQDAVKNFQNDNRLVVDGIVGFKTWSKLLDD